MIQFKCPNCAKVFRVDDSLAGKHAKCPGCGQRIAVPGVPAPPSSASAQPPSQSVPKAPTIGGLPQILPSPPPAASQRALPTSNNLAARPTLPSSQARSAPPGRSRKAEPSPAIGQAQCPAPYRAPIPQPSHSGLAQNGAPPPIERPLTPARIADTPNTNPNGGSIQARLIDLAGRVQCLQGQARIARRQRARSFARQWWVYFGLLYLPVSRFFRGAPVAVFGWPWAVVLIGTTFVGAILILATSSWLATLAASCAAAIVLYCLLYLPPDSELAKITQGLRYEATELTSQRKSATEQWTHLLADLAESKQRYRALSAKLAEAERRRQSANPRGSPGYQDGLHRGLRC